MRFLLLLLTFLGCSTVYYKTWENLGYEKRDLLYSRVQAAKDAQENSAVQFRDALTRLRDAYPIQTSELSKTYERVNKSYEDSKSASDKLKSRIDAMHSIASDLFEEWKKEADTIETPSLRNQSIKQLEETKRRYSVMRGELLASYDRTGPVLRKFRDYVLFLKHNLNAQSLSSLAGESDMIQADIEALLRQMERSIMETEQFLRTL
jgi:DNA helicase HerA-like ATPase